MYNTFALLVNSASVDESKAVEVLEAIYLDKLTTEKLSKAQEKFMEKYNVNQIPPQDYERMVNSSAREAYDEYSSLRQSWGDNVYHNLQVKVGSIESHIQSAMFEQIVESLDLYGDDVVLLSGVRSNDETINFFDSETVESELLKRWLAEVSDYTRTFDEAKNKVAEIVASESYDNLFTSVKNELRDSVLPLLNDNANMNDTIADVDDFEFVSEIAKLSSLVLNLGEDDFPFMPSSYFQLFYDRWNVYDCRDDYDEYNVAVIFAKIKMPEYVDFVPDVPDSEETAGVDE